jgi:hypothetical protein
LQPRIPHTDERILDATSQKIAMTGQLAVEANEHDEEDLGL